MSGHVTTRADSKALRAAPRTAADPAGWLRSYLHTVVGVDGACALAGGLIALMIRFEAPGPVPVPYVIFTAVLPLLWWLSVALARVAGSFVPGFRPVGAEIVECG